MPAAVRLGRSRYLLILLAVTLGVSLGVVAPTHGRADDAATLTVVGTSDVNDSNLVPAVLKPGFEAAFPQYKLNYVSQGTGAAIAFAEAGTASALLVHAASLENQFVAGGFSAEPFGRAIFWGDYVLLGPAADPAGVLASSPHDIVTAFEKIAAAGAAGTANFVSRGGTPGTTVAEHAIWALTGGVTTCTVSAANGGGTTPSTAAGACPATVPLPAWYHASGLTQGPNITLGDTCPFTGGNCYVLTDRGTFNFLQSTGLAKNLHIVVRDNDPAARGTNTLLVNSFHAYAINPAKFAGNPNVAINSAAATAFLNWVTSPGAQAAIRNFLSAAGDPPFLPSAAPALTTSAIPKTVKGGRLLTVRGNIKNVVPGTPALDGVRVGLIRVNDNGTSRTQTLVKLATTDAAGNFVLRYKPHASQRYIVSVPRITKVENSTLSPVFGDLLNPTTKSLGRVVVTGTPRIRKVSSAGGVLRLRGRVIPKVIGGRASVRLYAVHRGHGPRLHFIGAQHLRAGATRFDVRFRLDRARWTFQLKYVSHGQLAGGFTHRRKGPVH